MGNEELWCKGTVIGYADENGIINKLSTSIAPIETCSVGYVTDYYKKFNDCEKENKMLKKDNDILVKDAKKRVIKGIYPNQSKGIIVVKFQDDSIVKIKCCEEDEFDINIGVALAYAYKCFGSKSHFKKEVKRLTKEKKENGK